MAGILAVINLRDTIDDMDEACETHKHQQLVLSKKGTSLRKDKRSNRNEGLLGHDLFSSGHVGS